MSVQETALHLRTSVRALIESAQRLFLARVAGTGPLRLELLDGLENDALLDIGDDFDLSGGMRLLTSGAPLRIDDTVLLHKQGGQYVLFDVIARVPETPEAPTPVEADVRAHPALGAFGGIPCATRVSSNGANVGVLGVSDGSVTEGTSRVRCVATRACGGIRLAWANWSYSNEGGSLDAIAALKASVETADGGIYPVSFDGSVATALGIGFMVVSDVLGLELAAGEVFYVRTYVSGTRWPVSLTTEIADGEGFIASESVGAATITPSATAVFSPTLILAAAPSVWVPTVGIVGDSIVTGKFDTPRDLGFMLRALGGRFGYVHQGRGGALAQDYTDRAFRRNRLKPLAAATHVVVTLGVNDIGAGRSFATVQADLLATWDLFTKRGQAVFQTTTPPRTTSSDGWATLANQTINSNEAARVQLNDWLRTKPAPLVAVWDVADAVESGRNSGKWMAPGYTNDGIHPLDIGHAAMAAKINVAEFA